MDRNLRYTFYGAVTVAGVAGGVATGGMIYYGPTAACPTFAGALGVTGLSPTVQALANKAAANAATTAALLARYHKELAEAQRHLAYYALQQQLLEKTKMISPIVTDRLAYWQSQVDYFYYAIQNLRK